MWVLWKNSQYFKPLSQLSSTISPEGGVVHRLTANDCYCLRCIWERKEATVRQPGEEAGQIKNEKCNVLLDHKLLRAQ